MQMSSRIRLSWERLGVRLGALQPGTQEFVFAIRDWMNQDASEVSVIAKAAIEASRNVKYFREAAPDSLPISFSATEALREAMNPANASNGPEDFALTVDRICGRLAIFVREDEGCFECQSETQLWTNGWLYIDFCTLLGCCFESVAPLPPSMFGFRPRSPEPDRLDSTSMTLRPARRAEVLAHFPTAPLVPQIRGQVH